MNKKFADAFIISKAPEWVSCGRLILAQHIVSLHYQNRRPTWLSFPLQFFDICVEPIIKQINHWRAKIISRDFEAYPKNMGYLIAAYSCHQIFCSKKLDPLPSLCSPFSLLSLSTCKPSKPQAFFKAFLPSPIIRYSSPYVSMFYVIPSMMDGF